MASDNVILHPSTGTSINLYPKTTLDQVFLPSGSGDDGASGKQITSVFPLGASAGTYAISSDGSSYSQIAIANMPTDLTTTGNNSYILKDSYDGANHSYSYSITPSLPILSDVLATSKLYALNASKPADNGSTAATSYSYSELEIPSLPSLPSEAGTYILTVAGSGSLTYSYSKINVDSALESGETYGIKYQDDGGTISFTWQKVSPASAPVVEDN